MHSALNQVTGITLCQQQSTHMPQPTAAHEIEARPCSSTQRVDIAATQVSCRLLRKASAVIKLSSTAKLLDCTCRSRWHLSPGMIQIGSLHAGMPLHSSHACHI